MDMLAKKENVKFLIIGDLQEKVKLVFCQECKEPISIIKWGDWLWELNFLLALHF